MVRKMLAAGGLVGVCAWLAATASAAEVTVRNDSFESGGAIVVVGDFVAGEHAAVRLTSPCDGTIVAVQIGWWGNEGAEADIEQGIYIYKGSTFPQPGAELAFLDAPLLTPRYINEFRYLDEESQVPLSVPVSAGEQFYVSLEFAKGTDVNSGAPSVFRDLDGCTAGGNALYAIPGGWLDFCLFLGGDLVIRAVVDCGALPGACCLLDGTCDEMLQGECEALSGTFQGEGTSCASVTCDEPVGACCIEATGGCLTLSLGDCNTVGGDWAGPGTSCETYVCYPQGACCLPDGTCADGLTPEECAAQNGVFQGDGTTCATTTCPDPVGACCLANGGCILFTEAQCGVVGGLWGGPATTCDDNDASGKADICELTPGDMNCDGAVNGFDIDPFVLALVNQAGYETAYPECHWLNADTDGDGMVTAFDIDPFVILLVSGS